MFFLLPPSFSAWKTLIYPSKPNSNVTSSKPVLQDSLYSELPQHCINTAL